MSALGRELTLSYDCFRPKADVQGFDISTACLMGGSGLRHKFANPMPSINLLSYSNK